MSSHKALVLIADGTEEMEFTITYDTLTRGGLTCTSAFVAPRNNFTEQSDQNLKLNAHPGIATCSRGVRIVADVTFDPETLETFGPDTYDLLVIPGGAKGAETISNDKSVQKLVREYLEKDKWVGMICAGSLAAKSSGLTKQPITSHPSVREQLEEHFEYSEQSVVVSGKLVTSRGPGTAFPFALALVELIASKEKRMEITSPMMFPANTPL